MSSFSQNVVAEEATHVFISLSDLIQEQVFYHPELLSQLDKLNEAERAHLDTILNGQTIEQHFVDTLVNSIDSQLSGQSYNHLRLSLSESDSYSYSALIGGAIETQEINPKLGLRGVSRFTSEQHGASFELECKVIKALREKGYDIEIVVPFVRTLSDAAMIIDRLAVQGLPRGLNGLKVLYCCDTPSAVLLSERLLQYFDGVVVNTANLTQLTLGIDVLNDKVEAYFNLENDAVLQLIAQVAKLAANTNKPCVVIASQLEQAPKLLECLSEFPYVQLLQTN